MTRPPPRSTLFPFTTLFRSVRGAERQLRALRRRATAAQPRRQIAVVLSGLFPHDCAPPAEVAQRLPGGEARSEEHTSELQSPYDLVCRLLLEKKNENSTPEQ